MNNAFPSHFSTAVAAEQFHKSDSEYLSENSHKKCHWRLCYLLQKYRNEMLHVHAIVSFLFCQKILYTLKRLNKNFEFSIILCIICETFLFLYLTCFYTHNSIMSGMPSIWIFSKWWHKPAGLYFHFSEILPGPKHDSVQQFHLF